MNYKLPMHYGASPKLFEYAKQMRHAPTEAELLTWGLLTGKIFDGHHFRRQHPIATFIADFYLHPVKLVIEIDGGYHQHKFQKEYDDFRDKDMEALNIFVLRLTNHEIINSPDTAVIKIVETIYKRSNAHPLTP
jgi:very-short-patch-repair endonuclease